MRMRGGLVDEVLRKAGGNDRDSLGAWSRSIVDRALERAGGTARQTVPGSAGQSTAPLPAERHAGGLSGPRSGTVEILIFTSLSVPAQSWRQWARDAARAGVPLVLRGVGEGGLPGTAKRIGARLGGHDAGVAIDPRLFRLFGVTRVPAVIVVPGGVAPCRSRGCMDDPTPPHDRVTGNIGLIAALEAVADEGSAGRETARRILERLGRRDDGAGDIPERAGDPAARLDTGGSGVRVPDVDRVRRRGRPRGRSEGGGPRHRQCGHGGGRRDRAGLVECGGRAGLRRHGRSRAEHRRRQSRRRGARPPRRSRRSGRRGGTGGDRGRDGPARAAGRGGRSGGDSRQGGGRIAAIPPPMVRTASLRAAPRTAVRNWRTPRTAGPVGR